ncbi:MULTISPECIES: serine--tRNA ligase [unclassified Veillonella]|uniref:serine--tRNA ligase n=1 Tax=unclassified Veillonella TaxID=2630086 RepID=UPI00021A3A05|nr:MULTISPECIES: serine--tRNA ligase [unclassified Veillonella]EGS33976.1 serine--tRNA ligase [Veillonella sp. oral taxon 780 str. F0422]MBS6626831.1 serine--tRNA ligase [Veillonella sp. oral taxon 780]
MLDLKFVRENIETVQENLDRRHTTGDLASFVKFYDERRAIIQEVEQLKAVRNAVTAEISQLKRNKENADDKIAEMQRVGDEIGALDTKLRDVETELQQVALMLPNMCDASVPVGADENENIEQRRWGTPRSFDFDVKAHWDLGESLGILDFERAAKESGARFTIYKGIGARLERALINFMLDMHGSAGFTEMMTPYIVTRETLTNTGQLPKFAEDMYKVEGENYFLIPTAEVTLTNYHANEILSADELPKYYTAFTACFRAEAGSAGRDTRGLIRQHQFNKVELVKFAKPEESFAELETLTAQAESILQVLELPHRVITLCTGDMGFGSAKTYDIEVWMPSQGVYREISSCSNMTDFQARRGNIKFRREQKGKPEFVHTLNGSGLAVGRTVAAILENNQEADGSVRIPTALQPYMGGLTHIHPEA